MLPEPLAGSPGRGYEIPNVSVKVPARQGNKPFWLQRPLVSSQSFVGDGEMISQCHHHKRCRADMGDVCARFVF
jgi:hypothetical protein